MSEQIQIHPYNSLWKEAFESEKKLLLSYLPQYKDKIVHIGSTAVPNMHAKPVIDMMLGVKDMNEADILIPVLLQHGWEASESFNNTLEDKRFLRKRQDGIRTHHLHLMVYDNEIWQKHIIFRDKLISKTEIAIEYQNLKYHLASQFRDDREAYTEAKTDYISCIIQDSVIIRPLTACDSIEELTALINKAYKRLSDMGFNYTASYQDMDTTNRRILEGSCYLATLEGKVLGTITYHNPSKAYGNNWYEQDFVASFGQFAVDTNQQSMGIGSKLIKYVEHLAKIDKATELSLDTAEGALHLISFYEKRGYRPVGYVQWEGKTYRSLVLSKSIFD